MKTKLCDKLQDAHCPDKHGRVCREPWKSDLYSVHVYSSVHWTSHFFQICLTGHRESQLVGGTCGHRPPWGNFVILFFLPKLGDKGVVMFLNICIMLIDPFIKIIEFATQLKCLNYPLSSVYFETHS